MDFFHNEFEVYPLEPSGFHYVLPPRNLGRLRFFGYVFIAVGIASAIAGLVVIAQAFRPQVRGLANWLEILLLFKNWFMVIAVLAFTAGWLLLFGRSEIKLQHGKLRAIERAGILRWRFKQSASKIKVLELFDRNFAIYGVPVTAGHTSDLCVVRAGKMNLAPGYPYQTCLMLAEHLQDHWAAALGLEEPAAVPHVIDGTHQAGTEDDVWPDEFLVQPSASSIQLADAAEHLTLRIPPKGFKWDMVAPLLCSLVGLLVAAVLTGVALADGAFRGPGSGGLAVFFAACWSAAIVGFLYTIDNMRNRAAIVVAGNRLLIVTKNIFRRKRTEWRRDEVRAVVAASANPSPDHKPRIELQIRTVGDKTIRFFTGRPADELQWLAAVIRHELFAAPESEAPTAVPADAPKPQPRMVLEPLAEKW